MIPPHPLKNFEMEKYYENEPRFNGVFSGDNLPKKMFLPKIVYFNSFGVEHAPEEIKEFIGNKNITTNIFRAQANNSVMCSYFYIGFIDFVLAGKKK